MPGLTDIYAELQKVFLDRFAKPRDGHPGDAFVAFAFGTPIPDESFRLNDPARTISPDLAAEFMANHADVVPDVRQSCFVRSSRTVTNQFMLLLNGATAADGQTSELLGVVKAQCRPQFEPITGLKGQYRRIDVTPVNWFDASDDENWSSIDINHQDNPPPPPPPTGGTGNGTSNGFGRGGILNHELLMWREPPKLLQEVLPLRVSPELLETDAVKTFNPRFLGDPPRDEISGLREIEPGAAIRHVDRMTRTGNTSPLSFRSRAARRRRLGLEQLTGHAETMPELARDQILSKKKFISALDIGLLTAALHDSSTAHPVTSDGFKLSLRYCLVELRRPWLSDALLTLPGWFINGFARGDFSKGAAENEGNMAHVPTACIVVRDVKITANWSDVDKAVLKTSAEIAGFSLLGRDYDQNTQTLSIPGMQSFAWICQPMPVLPPANPPA